MLTINKENIECELNFDGIKVFQTSNPVKLYKNLILESNISIDSKIIKRDNIIYINELTKLDNFVSLGKKSFLIREIINLLDSYPIINVENIKLIKDYINNKYSEELIDVNDGDVGKVINLFLEFINSEYLNKSLFKFVLENCFDESKLIILDQVSWLNIQDLYSYVNEHKFIVITHDFRNYIENSQMLELLVSFKDDYNYVEMLDSNKLLVYLEQQMNIEIDDTKIDHLLNDKNSQESVNFYFNVLKI